MNRPLYNGRLTIFAVFAFLSIPAVLLSGQDRPRPAANRPVAKPPATVTPGEKAGETTIAPVNKADVVEPAVRDEDRKASAVAPSAPVLTKQQAEDDKAIRDGCTACVAAYNAADAKSVAAHFAKDAEYVDQHGEVSQGRAAIEASLTAFFAENPGCQLTMTTDTLRFVSPGVVIEDGLATVTHKNGQSPIETPYTTVHVKTKDTWQTVSVRDHAPKNSRQHRSQLAQLEWLTGDWVDESDDSLVVFSCRATDSGNYLVRTFTIQVAGEESMSGTQRIGWDPQTGKLRMWMFDSQGGYGEGVWHRNDEGWTLSLNGLTADGETTSSKSIYTVVNGHTMTWQSVDHENAGVLIPDSEPITIVRRGPAPELPEVAIAP